MRTQTQTRALPPRLEMMMKTTTMTLAQLSRQTCSRIESVPRAQNRRLQLWPAHSFRPT